MSCILPRWHTEINQRLLVLLIHFSCSERATRRLIDAWLYHSAPAIGSKIHQWADSSARWIWAPQIHRKRCYATQARGDENKTLLMAKSSSWSVWQMEKLITNNERGFPRVSVWLPRVWFILGSPSRSPPPPFSILFISRVLLLLNAICSYTTTQRRATTKRGFSRAIQI